MHGYNIGKHINIIQKHNNEVCELNGIIICETKKLIYVKFKYKIIKLIKNKNLKVLINEKECRN